MQTTATILVIDDDCPTADFIREALTDEGYLAHTVTQAADGVMIARTTQPDLVLCDLHMPGRDGISLIADLQGRIDVPIIGMTTADAKAAYGLSIEGVAFCLFKPFDLDELIDCVATHIRVTA